MMIGDTMETDILGGVQLGYRTILVLSGGMRQEDLVRYPYRPDLVIESVAELCASPGSSERLLELLGRHNSDVRAAS